MITKRAEDLGFKDSMKVQTQASKRPDSLWLAEKELISNRLNAMKDKGKTHVPVGALLGAGTGLVAAKLRNALPGRGAAIGAGLGGLLGISSAAGAGRTQADNEWLAERGITPRKDLISKLLGRVEVTPEAKAKYLT